MLDFEGAIFDLDGTLLDSMGVWENIDIKFLEKRGFTATEDYIKALTPMGFRAAAKYTIERFGLNETAEDIIDEWNRMSFNAYCNEVRLKPHAKEYLLFLTKSHVKLGIATALTSNMFEPALKNNDIFHLFDIFTSLSEVKRGKGFPDIYLLAAQKLGLPPTKCMVFEDISAGIIGAKSGGFRTCGVYDKYSEYEWKDIIALSDKSIMDFGELL